MHGNGRRALALGVMLALGAAAPGLCGMAELGKNSTDTSSGGGKVKLKVNPLFTRNVSGGDTVDQILTDLANQVNAHPQKAWTATHAGGTNSITVVRKDGAAINIEISVEGTSFEALSDTGFDRVRVSRGAGGAEFFATPQGGIGTILPTDTPAGDGSVTVTVNGSAVMVSTSGHSATSLLAAIATELQTSGFPAAEATSAGVKVPGVYDLIFEESDSGIDSFGVGVESPKVPTLSQLGMIALMLLLLLAAMWQIRRHGGGARVTPQ